MNYVKQQIADELSVLPIDEQQKVLDFVRSLSTRFSEESEETESKPRQPKTFGGVIDEYAGRVDSGHTDLSSNKAHMKDFGHDSIRKSWKPSEQSEGLISFAEAAREYIGCLDGEPDLSTNQANLKGLGKE